MQTENKRPEQTLLGRVLVNHLGFLCGETKRVIVRGRTSGRFEIQDMSLNLPATMGGRENFCAVFSGELEPAESPLGTYAVGDFSALADPGIYRVVLPETGEHSYHFAITDGVFAMLPEMFFRYIRSRRSGAYENLWRGPSHMDDGVRTDNGQQVDAVGGWYDAGDVRKWMVYSNLPAWALMEAHERIPWTRTEWEIIPQGWSPWLMEALWGMDFMLKMQSREDGMFYEDVGGGRDSRKQPGMSWWYANASGCYADNADNRFTDNVSGSGDERPVRIQYNPIAQFVSTAILARGARLLHALDSTRAGLYLKAARHGWKLGLDPDPQYLETPGVEFSGWTSVMSWRCEAALELFLSGHLEFEVLVNCVSELLGNFDLQTGFWRDRRNEDDPYRGILHSAQPVIVLSKLLLGGHVECLREEIAETLRVCRDKYILPMTSQSPFHFMPFGLYRCEASPEDLYRTAPSSYLFRFFMPEKHPEKINHGLSGHWTSWAHGLALLGKALRDPNITSLAWQQIYWLCGQNLHNSCVISGLGYNNPMPHSRLQGTHPGGFCTAFIGSVEDMPVLDLEGNAQWNTTEYWMVPLSNAMLALSILNPKNPPTRNKLGCRSIQE